MADDRLETIARLAQGTLIELLGIRVVELGDGRAVEEMEFRPDLCQLTGLLHGGAILALADTTATGAAMTVLNPEGDFDLSRFPLAIQISANLVRNTDRGKITAEAVATHRGRTTIVVETKVRDEGGRLLALTTTTLLVPQR